MMTTRTRLASIFVLAGLASFPVAADDGIDAYRALGLKPADVLSGTVISASVLPGSAKQVVAVVTHFTGSRDKRDAVNVRLAVFERGPDGLRPAFERDFGALRDGFVSDGNLSVVDLDRDGTSEMIVTWDDHRDPLVDTRLGEVILHDGRGLVTAWTGPVEFDATRAVRDVPVERRDRYVREFDLSNTMRTRGLTLFVDKTVIAVAGERLPQPRRVQETFALRSALDRARAAGTP